MSVSTSPTYKYGDDYAQNSSVPYSSSFANELGYGEDMVAHSPGAATVDNKPRILLMGLRRSGKSSIQKVVFHKMSPNETLFLESTSKLIKNEISNSSFVQFQIWDFPGQVNILDQAFDADLIFGGCGALVFIIDSQCGVKGEWECVDAGPHALIQDDYTFALQKLNQTVTRARSVNPNISFEVFIHKVDGLTDDHKIEVQRAIQQQAQDDLAEAGIDDAHLSFYLTSIYDHSIFEAFSKVIQKLIPQLPTLENLLDMLVSNSKIEKAFLIDVVSKIYVATDHTFVDMSTYELCSDMIDVVIDISCIYGMSDEPDGMAYDRGSSAIIRLSNKMVLYLREVNRYLALVALLREEDFDKHGLIDYNFSCFRKAIAEVFVKGAPQ